MSFILAGFASLLTEMFLYIFLLILTKNGSLCQGNLEKAEDWYAITIRMPNVTPDKADALVCTAKQLDPEEAYIVRFTPHASKEIAHHMMVYGCREPASYSSSWVCDKAESTDILVHDAVCQDDPRQIIFAWALDASGKSMPEGVGLRVSGDTGIHYLIVQMHYTKALSPGETDNSGYTIELTHKRPPQQAGYMVIGNWGVIPAYRTDFHMDSSCQYPRNYTIYPFAYRTHSHNIGIVTSGYRIRSGEWTEIGRMSPLLPQAFYNVSHPGMDIRPGDILASRCTMNSMSRDTDTMIGHTNHDEMCNFYIMYSTYEQGTLENIMCFQDAKSQTLLGDFPPNSGSLDGIPGTDEIKRKFNIA